jgi:hypothetical protein
MPDSRPVYVLDANILIDLHVGGLIEDLFRLPFRLVTPDVIVAELWEPDGETLMKYGLEKEELSSAEVQKIVSLRDKYLHVSVNDLFALVLARALQATLVTGDRHLSEAATGERVPVHGTLWVLDKLVGLRIVNRLDASKALNRMLAGGSRLPKVECQKRLREWSKNN